jgi:hypothetical protein
MREREDSEERLSEGRDQRLSPAPKPVKKARRALGKNALRVGLGLLVGLCVTEGAFRVRDGGAFPHINVYVPDAELGTRLRPGATEKVQFGSTKNPVTRVRINSEGYRGDEWAAKSDDEIVVVGDSQVFGLGVEEEETFSQELSRSLTKKKYVVRNMGVPTYGPGEYNKVLAEALAKRPAKTVVWVANMANDLFEAGRPNKDRHAVWDGWAVRKENAPASITSFPGRGLLFTDSHAFYAARRFAYERGGEKAEDRGVPSEGTWKDIAGGTVLSARAHETQSAEQARLTKLHESQIKYARDSAEQAERALDYRIVHEAYESNDPRIKDTEPDYQNPDFIPRDQIVEAARMSPGDILHASYGESGRDVHVNAEIIRRGAALRAALEKSTREKAEAQKNKELLGLFQARDAELQHATEIANAKAPRPPPLSPLAAEIAAAKAICDKYGARLLVVALPIDVQVNKAEWQKYGAAEQDMEPTKLLNADVVDAAEYVGAEGFDAMKTLAAAEPGAFLDADIHMTPKGHKALGQAIASVLSTPRLKRPEPGLPAGRSPVPRASEWTPDTEIAVTESDPAGCETKRVREWVGIFCHGRAKGVRVDKGRDVLAGAVNGAVVLIAPLVSGQDVHATFSYGGETRGFSASPGKDGAPASIAFTKPLPKDDAVPGPGPLASAFCACVEKQGGKCGSVHAAPSEDCARSYPNDCEKLLACAEGVETALPTCEKLMTNVSPTQACTPLCSPELPCAKGTCTSFRGGDVCL